jgi:CubicO group peptidase (beta-lactamase class C family)
MASGKDQVIDANTLTLPQRGGKLNEKGAEVAPILFAGLFSAGSGGYHLWNVSDWNSFVSKWSEIAPQNLRLVSVETYQQDSSTTWYMGAWTQMTGGYALWRTPDWNNFMTTFNNNKASMRLLDFDVNASSGSRWFTGTWGSTPINQTIIHDLDWNDFVAQWKTLSGSGWRLTKIQVYPAATTWYLTGLFEQGGGGYALLMESNWTTFYQYYQANPGMQLVDFQVYDDNNSTRWYIGVWRETSASHQFIFSQDWGSFVSQWNTISGKGQRLQKATQYANTIEVPESQWDQVFQNALGQSVMGYSYFVMHGGQVIAQGVNHARASQDPPQETWTADTRINLASVSKSITAVAVMKLLSDYGHSVDDAFYPLVKSQFQNVGPGVDKVTIRNLLEMKSCMVADGTLYPANIWTFLSTYLQAQNVPPSAPSNVEAYSNTNFTILQAVIDCVTGHGGENPDYYVTYVSQKVLAPMGINLGVFNAATDHPPSATLSYSGASDTDHGQYWPSMACVAAGGWITSARELAKFQTGVRNNVVLSSDATQLMLYGQLGWYTYDGIYGQYFHHNGGLLNGATPAQGLVTGIIQLTGGYDALLLVNSRGPNTIGLMIQAFETRT